MRVFTALVPPDDALSHLEAFLEPRRSAADLRWSATEQLHTTLAFMADVEDWRVEDLVETTASAAARRTPFAVRVAGGGAFPHADRAKVLWAGLALDEPARGELDRLAQGCRTAAVRTGCEVDGQRFRPHVTVARTGHPRQLSDWVKLLDGYAGPPWTASAVRVVASHLGEGARRRPRHEVLAELPLGPGGAG